MTSFDNKEKAEENKYAHDKETEFKIYASFHKKLAGWVASKAKLDAKSTEEYTNALVSAHLGKNDNETLLAKIKHDLAFYGVHDVADREIREEMHKLYQAARDKILHG